MMKSKALSSMHCIDKLSCFNTDDCIDEFIDTLSYMRSKPKALSCPLGDSREEDDLTIPALPQSAGVVKNSQSDGLDTSYFHEGNSGNNGSLNLDIPSANQYSNVPWPPVVGTCEFRSVFCIGVVTLRPSMWKHQLETAEFCIAPQGSPCSNDGWILASLTRDHFKTFESNRVLAPQIISAWRRILNNRWTTYGRPWTCLQIVNKDEPTFCSEKLLEMWHFWLLACNVDFNGLNLVLISVQTLDSYCLIAVSFRHKRIQQLKGNRTQFRCDHIARDVVSNFKMFLLHVGDSRATELDDFKYEVLLNDWCTTYSDSNSGIVTMHAMECHEPDSRIIHPSLQTVAFRIIARVVFCNQVVTNKIN